MKKKLAILMVLAMTIMMFTGCGNKEDITDSSKVEDTSKDNEKKSDLKIAIVCDSAGQNDNGYNQSAVEGAKEVADQYSCEYKVVEPTESIGNTLTVLAEDGYNLIFSMAYDFDALINGEAGSQPIAEMYPDTTFVVFNASPNVDENGDTIHTNVISVLYNVNESSYLAGALSVLVNENASVLFGDGYNFTEPKEARAFGFIGGSDSNGITVFSVGFIEGAQKVAKDLGVNYDFYAKYDAGFSDSATGSSVAGTYFVQGANVVYACAGAVGDGVASKAKEVGKLAIQVDANKDDQQPGYILTSVIKNTKVVVTALAEAQINDSLNGMSRTQSYDLSSGATTITDLATIKEYIQDTQESQDKWKEINAYIADLSDQISNKKIIITNTQNGDEFDSATCPNIIIK